MHTTRRPPYESWTRAAALVAAVLCLPPAGSDAAAGETLGVDLSAEDQCAEGALDAFVGSLDAQSGGGWCAVRATTASGGLDGFFGLGGALMSRLPQPPEFFGFFREAEVSTSFLAPEPPPEGTEVLVTQVLNHLIIVWAFDQDGVAVVPVGDPILFFVPPAPPPYFAGTIKGKARYGEPFEVTVGMTMDAHRVTVRQGGSIVVAASLKKIFTHPDAMSHGTIFFASGDLSDHPIWSFGPASFRGVTSPAEVIIGSAPETPRVFVIHGVQRLGSEVRVFFE